MNANASNPAYLKLLEYERRSADFAPGSRNGGDSSGEWSGVTFRLGEERLACNIERISEILPLPQATPVPGSKPWILGLANVRGELLTIVDLSWYLSGVRTPVSSNCRLLAATLDKAPIGLLIDEVFGQRHFLDDDAVPADLPEDSQLSTVVSKQHHLGSETWRELDLVKLFNSTEFLNGSNR